MASTHPTRRSTGASAQSRIAAGTAFGLDAHPAGPRPMVSEPARMASTDTEGVGGRRTTLQTTSSAPSTSRESAVIPLTPPADGAAARTVGGPRPWTHVPSGMSEAEERADPDLAEAMRASLWLNQSKRAAPDGEQASVRLEAGADLLEDTTAPTATASTPVPELPPKQSLDGAVPQNKSEGEDTPPPPPPKSETVAAPGETAVVTAVENPDGAVTLEEEGITPPATPAKPHRPRAVTKLHESAEGKKPINATVYLDPCLRNTLFTVPAAVRGATDTALTAATAYGDGSFNWTTGAPIGGMAALAKGYVLPADVKVEGENGGVSLHVAVIDEAHGGVDPAPRDKAGKVLCDKHGHPLPGKPRGRTKARVEVTTNRGGVEFDLLELDANRQIDVKVETGKGDVLVLLPPNFHGPVHITAPEFPAIGPTLYPQCAPIVNPYESVWTTQIVPLGHAPKRGGGRRSASGGGGVTHGLMKAIANYVPDVLKEQDEYHDMAFEGVQALQKGSHSKLVIKTERGKVAIGYRDTADVPAAAKLGLRVGAASKSKHWWTL